MIYYDVTKMGAAKQRSGLTRVSQRLLAELGNAVVPVKWAAGGFVRADRAEPVAFQASDWLLTVELFSEAERPGLREFIARRTCRLAAMFHDAIPLRFPHITWPQSVQRHPDYVKLLAGFDTVLAISEASRLDLEGFWRWQGAEVRAKTGTIVLGADFDHAPRVTAERAGAAIPEAAGGRPALLCVGIVEPRKNQTLLLDVGERLWESGLDFSLEVVGRVNPHFGQPIERRMRELQGRESRFRHLAAADDRELGRLYAGARAVVFPTVAEGCGLPLLEALWRGVPCVCSDLPVLRENADGGGCLTAKLDLSVDWQAKLRAVLTDNALWAKLRHEAVTRELPRWQDTAVAIRAALG